MNLADILAALMDITEQEQRVAKIDELLAQDGVDLVALQTELNDHAAELTNIAPEDMTDEQIFEAELTAQLIAIVDEKIAESDSADAEEAVEAAAAEQQRADDDRATRAERARAATETLANSRTQHQRAVADREAVAQRARQAQPDSSDNPTNNRDGGNDAPDTGADTNAQEVAVAPVHAAATPGRSARRDNVPLGNVVPAPTKGAEADVRNIKHTILAAGDLPGYRAGQELTDMGQVAAAVHTGMSMVSRSQAPGIQQRLASIRREAPDHLFYERDGDYVKVDAVTDQRNLPGQSLVAAGGWCAPSEFLYDTCPITVSSDGMVDLPTITAARGGIKYSGKPDFASIWQNTGFIQSEVDAIAGVLKPCFDVPCPDDLMECRMDIAGICLRQPILTERGWPEKVEEFVEYAMLAHAHRMNAEKIRRMAAMATYNVEVPAPPAPSDTAVLDPHGPGAFESLLSVLELQAEFLRYSGRLARNAMLEGIAPYWLRGLLRSDISKKLGIDDRWGAGADAALDRWFADRGIRMTYVYDWQDSLANGNNAGFGGTVPTQWPGQVQILLYEPGTFFALQQDVIELTGVYDSVNLERNVYTRLFTEEGMAVCSRCGRSVLLTIDLCPNGLSGTQQRTMCVAS